MFSMIKQILNVVTASDTNNWSWTTRPATWDYFRAEYKNEAQPAYEYWNSTGKINYGD